MWSVPSYRWDVFWNKNLLLIRTQCIQSVITDSEGHIPTRFFSPFILDPSVAFKYIHITVLPFTTIHCQNVFIFLNWNCARCSQIPCSPLLPSLCNPHSSLSLWGYLSNITFSAKRNWTIMREGDRGEVRLVNKSCYFITQCLQLCQELSTLNMHYLRRVPLHSTKGKCARVEYLPMSNSLEGWKWDGNSGWRAAKPVPTMTCSPPLQPTILKKIKRNRHVVFVLCNVS